jgi:hypothetical protein
MNLLESLKRHTTVVADRTGTTTGWEPGGDRSAQASQAPGYRDLGKPEAIRGGAIRSLQ